MDSFPEITNINEVKIRLIECEIAEIDSIINKKQLSINNLMEEKERKLEELERCRDELSTILPSSAPPPSSRYIQSSSFAFPSSFMFPSDYTIPSSFTFPQASAAPSKSPALPSRLLAIPPIPSPTSLSSSSSFFPSLAFSSSSFSKSSSFSSSLTSSSSSLIPSSSLLVLSPISPKTPSLKSYNFTPYTSPKLFYKSQLSTLLLSDYLLHSSPLTSTPTKSIIKRKNSPTSIHKNNIF